MLDILNSRASLGSFLFVKVHVFKRNFSGTPSYIFSCQKKEHLVLCDTGSAATVSMILYRISVVIDAGTCSTNFAIRGMHLIKCSSPIQVHFFKLSTKLCRVSFLRSFCSPNYGVVFWLYGIHNFTLISKSFQYVTITLLLYLTLKCDYN